MADLNIRGVDEGIIKGIKVRAAEAGVTMKEYVLGVLEGAFPVKGAMGYKAVQRGAGVSTAHAQNCPCGVCKAKKEKP